MELQCSICFNNFNSTNHIPIILIPCSHNFCSKCIYKIYEHNYNNCPLCRSNFTNITTNDILFEIIHNSNNTNSKELIEILNLRIQEIISNNSIPQIKSILFNEYIKHYNKIFIEYSNSI